jgi:hypothetical protein
MPPTSQTPRTARVAQSPRRQPPLDHARNNAYRDHRCLRAPRAALPPPRPRERREGRCVPEPDHGGVAHEKGQPRRAALPAILTANDEIVPTNNNAPFVALRNCEERCRLRTSGGRVSAAACPAGPPWGDGGPTPPRRLAPSGWAIAKSGASVVPSGGSCTNSPGRPSAHSRCSSSRRAQCPHRPTPSRKAAHRESSASESSSARILVTDSWSFGRSRVTVFHTTSRSISK